MGQTTRLGLAALATGVILAVGCHIVAGLDGLEFVRGAGHGAGAGGNGGQAAAGAEGGGGHGGVGGGHAVPAGWQLVYLDNDSCATAARTRYADAAKAACSACTCGGLDASSGYCDGYAAVWGKGYPDPCPGGPGSADFGVFCTKVGDCTVVGPLCCNVQWWASIIPPKVNGTLACTPVGGAVSPVPPFSATIELCDDGPGDECVEHVGDVACPPGWPERRLVYGSSIDSRACSKCVCIPEATCTLPGFVAFGSTNCDGDSMPLDTTCKYMNSLFGDGSGSVKFVTPSTIEGSCKASGGEATGEVKPIEPYTLCCQASD